MFWWPGAVGCRFVNEFTTEIIGNHEKFVSVSTALLSDFMTVLIHELVVNLRPSAFQIVQHICHTSKLRL